MTLNIFYVCLIFLNYEFLKFENPIVFYLFKISQNLIFLSQFKCNIFLDNTIFKNQHLLQYNINVFRLKSLIFLLLFLSFLQLGLLSFFLTLDKLKKLDYIHTQSLAFLKLSRKSLDYHHTGFLIFLVEIDFNIGLARTLQFLRDPN